MRFSDGGVASLKGLRVGQPVFADFPTGRVSVDGIQPCCSMLNFKAPAVTPSR